MKKEIHYITGNSGKFKEVQRFIYNYNFSSIVSSFVLRQVNIEEIYEIQSLDQKKIALHKAQQAWHLLKKPLILDDSGIYFNKYFNFPGTLTKFVYDGIGLEGLLKLVVAGDRATFRLLLVYIDREGLYKVFEGQCEGTIVIPNKILAHPQLPYDDIFLPDGAEKTYAEMRGNTEFDGYFYRLMAVKKFLEWYYQNQL
jgi:XTP/dITP diphosphohydrolase